MRLLNQLKSRLFRAKKAKRMKGFDRKPRLLERLEDRSLLAGFVAGSIDGQDGWSGGTIPISPSVAQVVDQSGANSHFGIGAWSVSNNTSSGNHNGAFGGWPFGPGLAVSAGQPSSGAGADRF